MLTTLLENTPDPFSCPSDKIAQHRLLSEMADLVDAGMIRTTFGEHNGMITAANFKRAHAFIETGKSKGKIVLEGL